MAKRDLTYPEVRELRARVLDEREAKASLFIAEPAFSTLVGRDYSTAPIKPIALNAATGLPAFADGAVTSAAAEPEPVTLQLDLKTHEPKPRGPKA